MVSHELEEAVAYLRVVVLQEAQEVAVGLQEALLGEVVGHDEGQE